MKDVPLVVAVVLALILAAGKMYTERLRLEAGGVELADAVEAPLASAARGAGVASMRTDDGKLVVVAGPFDFADLPRHLVLILAPTPAGWRLRNAGVRGSHELPEAAGWIEPLYGEVRVDSSSTKEGVALRCAVDLWCDAVLEGRFALECGFQHVPGTVPERGLAASPVGPASLDDWVALLAGDPLPSR